MGFSQGRQLLPPNFIPGTYTLYFNFQRIMPIFTIWRSYLRILDRFPLRTQMVQTGIIMGAGDALSQKVIEKKPKYDFERTVRFTAIGFFFVAPTIRVWYLTLEKWFGAGVTISTTLKKVGTDQLFFAPLFSAAIISTIGTSQAISKAIMSEPGNKRYDIVKKDIVQVGHKLQRDYTDVVLTGWTIWPATQLINFYLVPFLVRPLIVSVVALFWNTYLAWKTNQKLDIKFSS